jgi:hypothetical protein
VLISSPTVALCASYPSSGNMRTRPNGREHLACMRFAHNVTRTERPVLKNYDSPDPIDR